MVFFVCSSCGSSLKKNQVENHWLTRCRQTQCVSCMDCSKEFIGQEYASHVKCITENEKYGGSQYKGKELKGEKKQETWLTNIQEKVANMHDMEPKLRQLLDLIMGYSNIPRKKNKFMKFLLNSSGVRDCKLIDKAWELIEEANAKQTTTNNNSNSQDQTTANNEDNNSSHPAAEKPDNEKQSVKRERIRKKKNKHKNVEKDKSNTKIDVKGGQAATVVNKKKNHVDEQPMDTNAPKKSTEEGGKLEKKKKTQSSDTSLFPNGNQDKPSVAINKKKKKRKHNDEQPMDTEAVKQSTAEEEEKVKKKRKTESFDTSLVPNENHNQEMTNGHNTLAASPKSFKWKVAITTVLKSEPEEGLKMSKLRKKVLSLYFNSSKAASSAPKSKEELSAILTKKLNTRNDKYVIHNNKVKLKK